MARTPSVFGDGVIAGAIGTLIGPVPAGERWYVTRLDCYNTSQTQDVTIVLYLRTTGTTSRQWKRATLDSNGGHCEAIDSKAVELEAGDMILGSASLAGAVTFYAAGIRES